MEEHKDCLRLHRDQMVDTKLEGINEEEEKAVALILELGLSWSLRFLVRRSPPHCLSSHDVLAWTQLPWVATM